MFNSAGAAAVQVCGALAEEEALQGGAAVRAAAGTDEHDSVMSRGSHSQTQRLFCTQYLDSKLKHGCQMAIARFLDRMRLALRQSAICVV